MDSKEEEKNIEIVGEIPKNLFCECSNLLMEAKICLYCSKNFCIKCRKEDKCPHCDENLNENDLIKQKIENLKSKCKICSEEMIFANSFSHPQSIKEHEEELSCECAFVGKYSSLSKHQKTCSLHLSSQLVKNQQRLEDLQREMSKLKKLELFNQKLKKENKILKKENQNLLSLLQKSNPLSNQNAPSLQSTSPPNLDSKKEEERKKGDRKKKISFIIIFPHFFDQ